MADHFTDDNLAALRQIESKHCAEPHTDGLTPFQRFENLARGVFNVPAADVDAADAAWRAEQALREKRPGRKVKSP